MVTGVDMCVMQRVVMICPRVFIFTVLLSLAIRDRVRVKGPRKHVIFVVQPIG